MFKKLSILSYLTLGLLGLSACSDDMFERPDNSVELPKGLTICVPHTPTTRASSTPSEKERAIESLTLFAYPMDGNTEKAPLVYQLMEDENVTQTSGTSGIVSSTAYDSYTLSDFPQGEYKVYVVANIFSDSSNKLAEDYPSSKNLREKTFEYSVNHLNYSSSSDSQLGGIPMSCDHSEVYVSDENGNKNSSPLATENFKFEGGSAALYADMTFCLAKVTVAIEDASGNDQVLKKAEISEFASHFPIVSTAGSEKNIGKASTTFYVSDPSSTLNEDENSELNGLKEYTFYTTENTFSSAAAHKLALTFQDGSNDNAEKTHAITLGEKRGEGYDIIRGHHYEYLISRDGKISLTVKEWQNVPLSAEINAPFELILEETKIAELGSGMKKSIKYTSDAEGVSVKSPTIDINGRTINFYNSSVTKDSVSVSINDNIPYSILKKITNNEDGYKMEDYNYFHVKANNLMKRVDIESLSGTPTFSVSPQNIIIDLREYISSAITKSEIEINFASNLPEVSCNIKDAVWDDGTRYADKRGVFEFVRDSDHPTKNNGTDVIKIDKLDDDDFWSTRKELDVTYTVSGEGVEGLSEEDRTRTVKITIIPYTYTYKIHLYVENGEYWDLPHIYVYQCLETPADLEKFPKTPVGYIDGGATLAALEYCFTSDIAFQGWKGYGGPDKHNPNSVASGLDDYGFLINQDFKLDAGNTTNSGDPLKTYKYMKFNEEHYKKLASQTEKCTKHSRCKEYKEEVQVWPGILMYRETSGKAAGWWTYELSGVAEPGRSIIMFANHDAGEHSNRFPDHNLAGVPLFDYEDKEGWFVVSNQIRNDYVNNRFYDDNPLDGGHQNMEPKLESGKIRIYHQTTWGWTTVYLAGWTTGTHTFYPMTNHPAGNNWFYVDVDKNAVKNICFVKDQNWDNRTYDDGYHAVLSGNSDRYYYRGNVNQETPRRP